MLGKILAKYKKETIAPKDQQTIDKEAAVS
jgi:hypothetical protein